MFLDFLAVAISSCSFVQHLVISNLSPNCPPPSAGAGALRGGGVLASQPASCPARGTCPLLLSLLNPCLGREGSSSWGSRCLCSVVGKKGFPGFPVARVWQVQVPKRGWGEERSPGLPAPMSVGAVLGTRGLAAQRWGLVGRGQESCPVPGAGLPRRAGGQSAIHAGRTVSVPGGMRVCVYRLTCCGNRECRARSGLVGFIQLVSALHV